MGGVVGLEKPDIVITHTDGTQTRKEEKERERKILPNWATAIGF